MPKKEAKTNKESKVKNKKKYEIAIYNAWCKRCGICKEFCPKKVLDFDETGAMAVISPDECIGCRHCELRCPDFAIEIKDME